MSNWLIVGLGNPGREHAFNRHNIGFMAVDTLVDRFGKGGDKNVFKSILRSGDIDGHNILFQKPLTYMNLSGEAVGECARFYKIPTENVIVIHDELDIPFGQVKIKKGGGAAGHNGLKSLDQHIGQDYWRVRLGIGHPGSKERVTGHVLNDFRKDEEDMLTDILSTLAENFNYMLSGEGNKFSALFKTKED